MNNKLRFELSFGNIIQLENKLNFCKLNNINNINIPCKGPIKKELYNSTFEYIKNNFREYNVVFHYSLYHQYSKNKDNSYMNLLEFVRKCNLYMHYEILLVSGSNKKKNFDVIDVLNNLKKEKNIKVKLGIVYNPYLSKYYDISSERDRYVMKLSSGLISSAWLQFGTDINLLEREVNHLKKINQNRKINLFGSLLIPSKQFLARFKFRPWRGVYLSDKYLNSLVESDKITKNIIDFYLSNSIIPLVETELSTEKQFLEAQNFIKL